VAAAAAAQQQLAPAASTDDQELQVVDGRHVGTVDEDDEEYEEGSEEDAATDKSEADAIENLSASASLPQEDEMAAFEDSEPVARVPDAGLGESEKMGVSPKMIPSFKSSRFSSSSAQLIPSLLSILLALAACLRHN